MSDIPKYTLIFYIFSDKYLIGFTADSNDIFQIENIEYGGKSFEDKGLTKKIKKSIMGLKCKGIISLALNTKLALQKIDKTTELMGLNYNT